MTTQSVWYILTLMIMYFYVFEIKFARNFTEITV